MDRSPLGSIGRQLMHVAEQRRCISALVKLLTVLFVLQLMAGTYPGQPLTPAVLSSEAELRTAYLSLKTDSERLALIETNSGLVSWAFMQSLGAQASTLR